MNSLKTFLAFAGLGLALCAGAAMAAPPHPADLFERTIDGPALVVPAADAGLAIEVPAAPEFALAALNPKEMPGRTRAAAEHAYWRAFFDFGARAPRTDATADAAPPDI